MQGDACPSYIRFVSRLLEATDGRDAIFPDSKLDQEADVANQVKLGVVDAQFVGRSIYTNLVPEFGIFDMGYVFNDYDHVRRATATPDGKALGELLVKTAGTRLQLGAQSWRNPSCCLHFSVPA
jgi:TRAP-type transport system periplasmic protein